MHTINLHFPRYQGVVGPVIDSGSGQWGDASYIQVSDCVASQYNPSIQDDAFDRLGSLFLIREIDDELLYEVTDSKEKYALTITNTKKGDYAVDFPGYVYASTKRTFP